MLRVGIRELRQNPAAAIAEAKAGRCVEVTEWGSPVALVTPLPEEPLTGLRKLEAEGAIVGDLSGFRPRIPKPLPYRPGEARLNDVLDELRSERF